MLIRRQWILLVLVFICTGLGVWMARSWSNRVQLAHVVIVPHDGVLLRGGLARWQTRLAQSEFAGVFYENPDNRMLLPFIGRLDTDLLAALQQTDTSTIWHNIAPDTLFLRSWSASYAKLIQQMPDSLANAINKREEELRLVRRLALLSSGARHDSLLQQLNLMPDEIRAAQHDRLYRRYAREMLHSFSKTALRKPGERWLLIIDVELYPYVKQAFASTPRFEHEW